MSATSRHASRVRPPDVREVTMRYRLPLVRAFEPVVGSVTRTASEEFARRSSSDTTPYLSANREAIGGQSSGGSGTGPRAVAGCPSAGVTTTRSSSRCSPSGDRPKASSSAAWRRRSSWAIIGDAALTTSAGGWIESSCEDPEAAGTSSSTRRCQAAIWRARRSCPSMPSFEPPGRPGRRLRGDRSTLAHLVTAPARGGTEPPAGRASPPTRSPPRPAPDRGRRSSSWSRKPAADRRCGARGAPAAGDRARRRRRRATAAAVGRASRSADPARPASRRGSPFAAGRATRTRPGRDPRSRRPGRRGAARRASRRSSAPSRQSRPAGVGARRASIHSPGGELVRSRSSSGSSPGAISP